MHILVVGQRLREYPRNRVLLEVLEEVHRTTEYEVPKKSLLGCLQLLWREQHSYDAILLMQPTKELIIPALLLRPWMKGIIIGDAFTSLYDTLIVDRALAGKRSIKALYYFLLDWLFVRLCDVLFFDTEEHREYFEKTFGLHKTRSLIVPVSVDMDMMRNVQPKKLPHAEGGQFQVLFCGYFIPLQGVEYIIQAAHLLRDHPHIRFTLLGGGQTKSAMEALARTLALSNVTFMDRVAYEDLLSYTKGADLALGIFGDGDKAKRVIANKIIESLGAGVPLVTGWSPPVARFFVDEESIFFAHMSDPEDLAKSILRAYNTKDLTRIGMRGQGVVAQHFSKENLRIILGTL